MTKLSPVGEKIRGRASAAMWFTREICDNFCFSLFKTILVVENESGRFQRSKSVRRSVLLHILSDLSVVGSSAIFSGGPCQNFVACCFILSVNKDTVNHLRMPHSHKENLDIEEVRRKEDCFLDKLMSLVALSILILLAVPILVKTIFFQEQPRKSLCRSIFDTVLC